MKLPYTLIKADKLRLLQEEYQKILDSNASATAFIKEIENGNLDAYFATDTSGAESLTTALLAMQHQLQRIAEEESQRNWTTQGLAIFAELLRTDNENSGQFYQKIISNLVKYLNANQGGLFLVNDQDTSDISIELVSCYAYNKQKYITKRLYPGEGLIGQCYLEKETIFMTDVPQSYITITSGLGSANPGCLVIVPLKVNEHVHGFVELASFKPLRPYQVEFIERLGESIASSIASVKINQHTRILLEESQQKAEEMKAQEEELRQNMEELSATQEGMERVMKEIKANERYVKDLMAASTDSIFVVDKDYKIVDFNPAFLEPFKHTGLQIEKGDSVFKVLAAGEVDGYKQLHSRAINGESFAVQEHISGIDLHFLSSYSPLKNEQGENYAVAIFAKNLTELVKTREKTEQLLRDSQQQAEQMKAQEEELRQNMEELAATQEEMSKMIDNINQQQQHFGELLNGSDESILAIDRNYQVISWNNTFAQIFGTAGNGISQGMNILDVYPPEEREAKKKLYDRVLAGEHLEMNNHMQREGVDHIIHAKYHPLKGRSGEIVAVGIYLREVVEQAAKMQNTASPAEKNVESASAYEREAIKHDLLNGVNVAINVFNRQLQVVDYNNAFEKLMKKHYNQQVETGMHLSTLIKNKKEIAAFKVNLERVFGGEAFSQTHKFEVLDRTNYVLLRYHPLLNSRGEVIAAAVYGEDITEIITLKQQNLELAQQHSKN